MFSKRNYTFVLARQLRIRFEVVTIRGQPANQRHNIVFCGIATNALHINPNIAYSIWCLDDIRASIVAAYRVCAVCVCGIFCWLFLGQKAASLYGFMVVTRMCVCVWIILDSSDVTKHIAQQKRTHESNPCNSCAGAVRISVQIVYCSEVASDLFFDAISFESLFSSG